MVLLLTLAVGLAACGDATTTGSGGAGATGGSGPSGGAAAGGAAAGGTSAVGGAGGAECASAADCGAATDCVSVACVDGACHFTFVAEGTPAGMPLSGDCADTVCDGAGNLTQVMADDPADDQNECTTDQCFSIGQTTHTPVPVGACGPSGEQSCVDGQCVDCIDDAQCATGVCDLGACVPTCSSDADCNGGFCLGAPPRCQATINGCDPATATDLTGQVMVTIDTVGLSYVPDCVRIKVGTVVTFNSDFGAHPFRKGAIVEAAPVSDGPNNPIVDADTGTSEVVLFGVPGRYGYYCQAHYNFGMLGALIVVP